MTAKIARVMNATNNYFAVLCERVFSVEQDGAALKGNFRGKYREGMLLRLHGAYTAAYCDFGAGEVYRVVSFDGDTLKLDHPLHTFAPNLFIATLEPTSEFLELCDKVDEWQKANEGGRGLASESIDGYSYSKQAGPNGEQGWEAAFADDLKQYKTSSPSRLYYARNAQPWSVFV